MIFKWCLNHCCVAGTAHFGAAGAGALGNAGSAPNLMFNISRFLNMLPNHKSLYNISRFFNMLQTRKVYHPFFYSHLLYNNFNYRKIGEKRKQPNPYFDFCLF
jgi:hypothetical protein